MTMSLDEYRQHVDAGTLGGKLEDELSVRWDDLTFAASGITINPVGAVSSPVRDEVETSFPGTLLFSGSIDNVIAATMQVQHAVVQGSSLHPHIHWTKPAGGAGDDVTWEFYYRQFNRGAAPGAWVGPVAGTMVINHNGIADGEAITSFGSIPLTTAPDLSANIAWRLYRRGSTDSFNGTARLIELDFHAQFDSRGSRSEFKK